MHGKASASLASTLNFVVALPCVVNNEEQEVCPDVSGTVHCLSRNRKCTGQSYKVGLLGGSDAAHYKRIANYVSTETN